MQDNFSVKNWKNTVLYEQDFKQELDIYGYQTKHFDLCPGAQNLYKRIMAGDFTDGMPSVKEQDTIITLAKLHDALFGMEKIALSSKDGVDKEFASKAQGIADKIMDISQSLDLVDEHGYIQNHVDIIRDKVNEMAIVLPEQEDDIELEIPGDESSATVDKKVQAKATRQDKIIKDFQRIQKQMQTHLELYKTSESEENKKTALQMLKNLTPEFQAAKKKYEKLKGVKV
tara:strand:+ start:2312 stop:2998 length:687 start_codon:yes stop_codon:yes gene_type:complete